MDVGGHVHTAGPSENPGGLPNPPVARVGCWPLRRLQCSRGQSLAEFAIVIPLLLVLFFGTLEFSRYFYTRLTIRHAVGEATRFAITGEQLIDPNTGNPMGRASSIVQTVIERAAGLPLTIENIAIDPPNGGGPEDIVTISATFDYEYSMPMMGALGNNEFTVTSSMRNEPYFP